MAETAVAIETVRRPPRIRQRVGLLHRYFESQVERLPAKTAVECDGDALTYAELDAMANRVAHCLRRRGVRPGDLVAIHLTKSVRLYAAILGVLKSGAGYVPIDSKFPRQRISDIIADSGARAVVTESQLAAQLDACATNLLSVDGDWPEVMASSSGRPDVEIDGTSIAYVIYTSGSTGRPKGVAIEHRNAIAFVRTIPYVYRINAADRIYQGFSTAFDASVEELWVAFSTGATLVAPTEHIARSPSETAEFLTLNRVSFFSTVPTFLAMIEGQLPTVRTLILGGEACPIDLVNRWADGTRRMLNTYGPTEATVVATFAECVAGRKVTIGQAMPGYCVHVLDEQQRPVAEGEVGELYIGGPAVARGYLHRPDLTSERFIADPFSPRSSGRRLYRTFDQVRRTDGGELEFMGRLDSQLKLRGFRIELSEIEQVIIEQEGIRAAAVTVVGTSEAKDLAAYVVPDPSVDLDRPALRAALRERLPEYMVPKFLDVVDALPMLTSGKVDRNGLPPAETLLAGNDRPIIAPANELERRIASVWQATIKVADVSAEDDFFKDLGGHSLLAAQMISRLRAELGIDGLSIRDVYKHCTVRRLAAHVATLSMAPAGPSEGADPIKSAGRIAFEGVHWAERWIVVGLQTLGVLAYNGIIALPFALVLLLVVETVDGRVPLDTAISLAVAGSFALWPSLLLLSIAIKWLVIGRYKPGCYPVWSLYYLRWWVATRFQALSWSEMFSGSPLMSLYYRAMGAKVGRNVIISTPICAAFDLVEIGDGASIGGETHMLGYRVQDGMLMLGRIEIGQDCFVGEHCALGLDVRMEPGSRLDDMSQLADGQRLGEGRGYRGAPAQPSSVDVPRPLGHKRAFGLGLAQLALIYVMGYLLILSMLPAVAMVATGFLLGGVSVGIAAALASVPVSILWYAAVVVAAKRLLIGRLQPGTYPVASRTYLRQWFLAYLMRNTRGILMPLYATIYFPGFLRWLGARIGKNAEVSTVLQMNPDMLEVGSGSFLADACIVGGQRLHGGTFELLPNRVGARTFIGNSAFVPAGVDIGDDCLIGVLSRPPADVDRVPDETRWLGSPGFRLPRTQQGASFTNAETFEPDPSLKRRRAVIDALRIVLPGLMQMSGLIAFLALVAAIAKWYGLWIAIALVPAAATAAALATLLAVPLVKMTAIGMYFPVIKPLWCPYVWLNELVNGVYEGVAAPIISTTLGTPLAGHCLRLMGCRVGRWTFIETTLFSEFDLVAIGDHACLNLGATIQTHLFEDRIFKSDHLVIGEGCNVGNMSVVLYNTTMGRGSTLGPLSLLMKGEHLPANTSWEGIPCQAVRVRYAPAGASGHTAAIMIQLPEAEPAQ